MQTIHPGCKHKRKDKCYQYCHYVKISMNTNAENRVIMRS